MKTDMELRDDVLAEIDWEPAVDGGQIGVTVRDRVVTLTGKVRSYFEKGEAVRAAKRVSGVAALADEMEVAWSAEARTSDTSIAEAIHHALAANVSVPQDAVKAIVDHGRVTLEGEVKWPFQRAAVVYAVESLRGVQSIINSVRVISPVVAPSVVKAKIEAAFQRRADIESSRITVRTEEGKVVLEGTVPTFRERDAAESAAWSAPGVHSIDNRIRITP